MERNQNTLRLIKHGWNILFRHNSWNERISRGELFIGHILLMLGSLLFILLCVPFLLFEWGMYVFWAIFFGTTFAAWYYALKLIKQRFNDIGIGKKGMRGVMIPGFMLIAGTLVSAFLRQHTYAISYILGWILAIIIVVVYFASFWYCVLLCFENGTEGENRYGVSPLARQPHSNRSYIKLGFLFFIVYFVFGIIISSL